MSEQIVHEIAQNIAQNKQYSNYGLLTGYIGHIIFLSEYSKVNSKYSDLVDKYIEQFYFDIEQGIISSSYSNGISGVCLGIGYLNQKDKKPFEFVSKSIDKYLVGEIDILLENQNLDFLHGALGIGFYFIERAKEKNKIAIGALQKILDHLIKQKIVKSKDEATFLNFNKKSDISLSHGLSGILIFLCELLNFEFFDHHDIYELLRMLINYTLNQKIDRKKYGSQFPYTSIEDGIKRSRLAWCYGDLGVCIALLKCAEISSNEELKQDALEILLFTTTRRNLEKDLVNNSEICHGTSGISLIYNSIYHKYGHKEFQDSKEFWINKTVEMYTENKSHQNLGLLEGISGTGLVLLDYYYNTGTQWSKFFLI